MKNKEFLSFIIQKEEAPAYMKQATKIDIQLSFRAQSIILRFVGFYLLGALFSMSVCPQFGLGLVQGHGITHHFRMIGDWACAAFCGSVFLSSGLLLAFIGMKGEELFWVWNRYKFSLMILPAFLWSALMMTNVSLDKPEESVSYHLTWIVFAIMVQAMWMKFRSFTYLAKATSSR